MFATHYILVLRQSTHNVCFVQALFCSLSRKAQLFTVRKYPTRNISAVSRGKNSARTRMALLFKCWQVNRKNKQWNLEHLKQQNIHAQEGNVVDCRAAADNSSWVLSQSHKLGSNKIIWVCSGVSLIHQPALIHFSQKSDFLQRFLQPL